MLSTEVLQAPVGLAELVCRMLQDPGVWCDCSAVFKFHFGRWKMTGEERAIRLGWWCTGSCIYTLRYLKNTLSSSPFGQKERIGILSEYLKYVRRYLAYATYQNFEPFGSFNALIWGVHLINFWKKRMPVPPCYYLCWKVTVEHVFTTSR